MAESEEELESLLMKVKEENEKAGLKLNIQKMKIMASGPITSWQIDGETVETMSDFFWGGFRMGDTCTPVADSCMAKPTTILSSNKLPIKINKVKKKKKKQGFLTQK